MDKFFVLCIPPPFIFFLYFRFLCFPFFILSYVPLCFLIYFLPFSPIYNFCIIFWCYNFLLICFPIFSNSLNLPTFPPSLFRRPPGVLKWHIWAVDHIALKSKNCKLPLAWLRDSCYEKFTNRIVRTNYEIGQGDVSWHKHSYLIRTILQRPSSLWQVPIEVLRRDNIALWYEEKRSRIMLYRSVPFAFTYRSAHLEVS